MTGEEVTVLADIDKRLALAEQASQLYANGAEARWSAVNESIKSLSAKIDGVLSLLQASIAEPGATPSGRALLSDVADLTGRQAKTDATVDSHESFLAEMRGALKLARFALGTSFLAVAGNIVLALAFLAGPK